MKPILIAVLLAGAAGGTVESVHEVPLAGDHPGPAGLFEESYKPGSGDELSVRLDDGKLVTVMPGAMQLFQTGERVLVIPQREGVRIEHADPIPFFHP